MKNTCIYMPQKYYQSIECESTHDLAGHESEAVKTHTNLTKKQSIDTMKHTVYHMELMDGLFGMEDYIEWKKEYYQSQQTIHQVYLAEFQGFLAGEDTVLTV